MSAPAGGGIEYRRSYVRVTGLWVREEGARGRNERRRRGRGDGNGSEGGCVIF